MTQRRRARGTEPSSREEIETTIKKILVGSFKITEEQIAPGTKFRRDLGLDEFQSIEFAGELEARFNVAIDSDTFDRTETIAQLIDYLKLLGASAS